MTSKCGCMWFGHSDPNTKCHPDCQMAKRIEAMDAQRFTIERATNERRTGSNRYDVGWNDAMAFVCQAIFDMQRKNDE